MVAKGEFEFVKLNEPGLIKSNLADISLDLKKGVDETLESLNVQEQKHEAIVHAIEMTKSIRIDIRAVDALLHKPTFERIMEKEKIELKKEEKVKKHEEKMERDFSSALRKLEGNLHALKTEIGA